jgi:2-phospho-L-lactate guanylyltransferase
VRPDTFLVPLKDFDRAKERLRSDAALDVPALARSLAAGVIVACAPVPVIVVTEDDAVADFARGLGAEIWFGDAQGLNDAVQRAYEGMADRFDLVAIVHGDLLAPQGLSRFEPGEGVTVVADHHATGTNVLALPTGLDFRFGYGADSAQRHRREATRLGLEFLLITHSPWSHDIDRPEDLELPPDGV